MVTPHNIEDVKGVYTFLGARTAVFGGWDDEKSEGEGNSTAGSRQSGSTMADANFMTKVSTNNLAFLIVSASIARTTHNLIARQGNSNR